MALPIPYITHSPALKKTAEGYLVDAQTEEFMQATRLVAGLVGGPVVYYGGSVMASEGHAILGNTLRVMGVACSVYHLWQYASVKYASSGFGGFLTNTTKRKVASTVKGKAKLAALRAVGRALRNTTNIRIPEDAYTITDED